MSDAKMLSELEPCPFCGSAAHPFVLVTNGWVRVACTNEKCEMGSAECPDPFVAPDRKHYHDDAIAAWNTRALEQRQLLDGVPEGYYLQRIEFSAEEYWARLHPKHTVFDGRRPLVGTGPTPEAALADAASKTQPPPEEGV